MQGTILENIFDVMFNQLGIPSAIAYGFIRVEVKLRNYEGWALAIFGVGWHVLGWFKAVGWNYRALYAVSFYIVYAFVLFYVLYHRIPMFQSLLATFLMTKVATEFGELPFHIRGILIGEAMEYWQNPFLALNYIYIVIVGIPLLYIMFRPELDRFKWIFISLVVSTLLHVIFIEYRLYSITADYEDVIHQFLYMLCRASGAIGLAYAFIPKQKSKRYQNETNK